MRLSQAVRRFAGAKLDAYNGSAWQTGIVQASVDIAPMPVGAPAQSALDSRYFISPDPVGVSYEALRFHEDVYLILDVRVDADFDGIPIRWAVLGLRTTGLCEVIRLEVQQRASGVGGAAVEVVDGNAYAAVFGDTVQGVNGIDQVHAPVFDIWLPKRLQSKVTKDSILQVDGRRYAVQAVFPKARALQIRTTQSGGVQ